MPVPFSSENEEFVSSKNSNGPHSNINPYVIEECGYKLRNCDSFINEKK